jgi:hypothetical protein
MNQARSLYLGACELTADLLSDPMVAAAWHEPSALAKLSVKGLAGHLAGQVFFAEHMLAEPVPTQPAIAIGEYYARVSWIGSDIDEPFNQLIRTSGEQDAADGPAGVAGRVAACVERLRTVLATAPNRPVRRPTWGEWSVGFDDFLTTRLLELVVHCDDLAYSVGVATPAFPAETVETVVDLLSRIALRRHGAIDVLRALSRAERAPTSIAAL